MVPFSGRGEGGCLRPRSRAGESPFGGAGGGVSGGFQFGGGCAAPPGRCAAADFDFGLYPCAVRQGYGGDGPAPGGAQSGLCPGAGGPPGGHGFPAACPFKAGYGNGAFGIFLPGGRKNTGGASRGNPDAPSFDRGDVHSFSRGGLSGAGGRGLHPVRGRKSATAATAAPPFCTRSTPWI